MIQGYMIIFALVLKHSTMRNILVFLFVFFYSTLNSQILNIENQRINDGTYGFSGALDMTLSAYREKNLLLSAQFKPLIQYKFGQGRKKQSEWKIKEADTTKIEDKNKHLLLFIGDFRYTATNGNTFANSAMGHLRYAYRLGNSGWKWESYTQIQRNKLLLQRVRYLIGSGVRSKMLDVSRNNPLYSNQAIRLFMGTSVFYEYEEINHAERPIEYKNTLRWSTYLSTYMNFKHVEFVTTTYIQPNLIRFKDFHFSGDYSLLFRVSEPFSIKFNYSYYYASEPPETVYPSTFSFSAGFVYKLDKFKIPERKKAHKKDTQEDESTPSENDEKTNSTEKNIHPENIKEIQETEEKPSSEIEKAEEFEEKEELEEEKNKETDSVH